MSAYSDFDITQAMKRAPECFWGNWLRIESLGSRDQIQPASVDLRLHDEIAFFPQSRIVDLATRKISMEKVSMAAAGIYSLKPGGFVLGSTMETVSLGSKIIGRVEGKSSLGRLGLAVHVTAGFIDPGFHGQITLELYNASKNTILLRPGVSICQMSFSECMNAAMRPYGSEGLGSRYQGQTGAQQARE